jgi:hypothetical protein
MMIFKKAIPRRTFLKGVGAGLALPLLDGMAPAFAGPLDTAGKPPFRISTVFVPNGRIPKYWIPTTVGSDYELTRTLQPLASFRDNFTVVSGLNIKAADAVGNEPGGVHARPAAAFLTGIHPKPGGELGLSMDQVAARELGKQTQLASLELGLDVPELAISDGSYGAYYMNSISWRGPTSPLPMEYNPRNVFERMFGDNDSANPAERLRRVKQERSILDSVSEGVARMMGDVSASDRLKLNEYLEAIRDVERRIQVAEKQTEAADGDAVGTLSMARPAGIPNTFSGHCKLMFDLQVLALQTDMTRVVTFMMGREQTDRTFREIGVGDGHHPLSHHKNIPETVEAVAKVDSFQSEMVAHYLGKLRSTPDGDGTLLDNSVILFGSSLGDGNLHLHNDIPVLVAGGAGGRLKGGSHIRFNGRPFSNLLLTIMELSQIPMDGYLDSKYSDATGTLDLQQA